MKIFKHFFSDSQIFTGRAIVPCPAPLPHSTSWGSNVQCCPKCHRL